jgi:glycine hydroxymethyltransferase
LAHITVNKNSIPNDPESPFVTSGIRIGTPAITTRGLKEAEAIEVVNLIADVLDHPGNDDVTQSEKQKVSSMMKSFPVYKK